MVLGNVLPLLHNTPSITASTEPVRHHQESQQEYNISSYLDFAEVSLNLMLTKLYNETSGAIFRSTDTRWEIIDILPSCADYYWAIASFARMYEVSVKEGNPNSTLSIVISRVATKMVDLFMDFEYSGFIVNLYSHPLVQTTKRAGVQSYAYQALQIAETVNATLDFSEAKQSAIDCLVNMLYDGTYGGFHFFTTQNGSLNVSSSIYEVYPNDGKRLDHLALGAMALYDAGIEQNNMTLIAMANSSMSFLVDNMRQSFQGEYHGLKLAVDRSGDDLVVAAGTRNSTVVVSDINAVAIRALLKAYEVTGYSIYLSLSEETVNALMTFNWDNEKGGWYTETLNGIPFDPLDDEDVKYYKYSEIQFQMVYTLEALYEITDKLFYIQMCIDVLDLVLGKLWDVEYGGFLQNGNQEWLSFTDDWKWHHTAIQGQAILVLQGMWSYGLPIISNVRVNPVSPRPNDSVLVSAIALDADGIDTVYVNYTMRLGDNTTNGLILLEPNPEVGGIFNGTFGFLNDTASANFYVIANDTLGNDFVAGVYYFLVRADIYEPIIELRTMYPEVLRAGEVVRLEFGTYEFPIHSATLCNTLHWKLNTGPYVAENTTLVNVDGQDLVWQIDIGPFVVGDVISFYSMAVDETGNWGTSPFYRLTIIGDSPSLSSLAFWQIFATIGLISAPGAGFAYVWSKKRYAKEQQRTLKKEARKRGRGRRGRSRSRSRSQSEGGN